MQDYTWAKKLGLVRKPANFISSISDDRGSELSYGGMPIGEVFSGDLGVGGECMEAHNMSKRLSECLRRVCTMY